MATVLKTKAEQRLEELEALQRVLTGAESAELKRCLHAIYMRNWRIERSVLNAAGELLDAQKAATIETNAIASRMISARDEGWLPPKADDWMEHARAASEQLRNAILCAAARAAHQEETIAA